MVCILWDSDHYIVHTLRQLLLSLMVSARASRMPQGRRLYIRWQRHWVSSQCSCMLREQSSRKLLLQMASVVLPRTPQGPRLCSRGQRQWVSKWCNCTRWFQQNSSSLYHYSGAPGNGWWWRGRYSLSWTPLPGVLFSIHSSRLRRLQVSFYSTVRGSLHLALMQSRIQPSLPILAANNRRGARARGGGGGHTQT